MSIDFQLLLVAIHYYSFHFIIAYITILRDYEAIPLQIFSCLNIYEMVEALFDFHATLKFVTIDNICLLCFRSRFSKMDNFMCVSSFSQINLSAEFKEFPSV